MPTQHTTFIPLYPGLVIQIGSPSEISRGPRVIAVSCERISFQNRETHAHNSILISCTQKGQNAKRCRSSEAFERNWLPKRKIEDREKIKITSDLNDTWQCVACWRLLYFRLPLLKKWRCCCLLDNRLHHTKASFEASFFPCHRPNAVYEPSFSLQSTIAQHSCKRYCVLIR